MKLKFLSQKIVLLHIVFYLISTNILYSQILDFTKLEPPYRLKYKTVTKPYKSWSVGGGGELLTIEYKNKKVIRKERKIAQVPLNSIYFADDKHIVVVGDDGKIIVSNDRAINWKENKSSVEEDLNSVFCVDKSNCWIVGDGGILLKGGLNKKWKKIPLETEENLFDIFMINHQIGYLVGINTVLRTYNGGLSWEKVEIPFSETHKTKLAKTMFTGDSWWQTIYFDDLNKGCIAGMHMVSCTTDGGNNWQTTTEFDTEGFDGTFFGIVYQKGKLHLMDEFGKNEISEDFGKTWYKLLNHLGK
jgi:photosystem II stability/assembly factor-like uncharacterized protein